MIAHNNHIAFQNETGPDDSQEVTALANLYGFLSLCFRYPAADSHDQEFFDSFLDLLSGLQLDQERQEVSSWLARVNDPLSDLQIEHTRLFINSVPHVIAPPYASIYMDGDNALQGKTTERIRNYYRHCGYDIVDPALPADHLQLQLDFLAQLAREGRLDREEEFLHNYFRPWFDRFSSRVLTATEHPFFRVTVQLIDQLTKEEQ